MKERTCSFITLGCKVNQYETDFMAQCFIKNGFKIVPLSEESDFVVINSCTVTNEADRKSRQMFRRARKISENAIIIATGCSVQIADRTLLEGTYFDYYLGNGEKPRMADIVDEIDMGIYKSSIKRAYWLDNQNIKFSLISSGKKTRQYIMVQEGCSNCCTYCKIFHARGTKSVSKTIVDVVDEIRRLNKCGTNEFVITGINLGEYNDDGKKFHDLLKKISEMPEEFRVRISSLNPEDITEEVCEIIKSEKFCPHLHISIQSGSNHILKRMNRKYTQNDIINAVERLRKTDRLFSISCDIIVGFPGETNEDFEQTTGLLKKIKPLKTHVFRYSPKKGTPASKFANQIDGNEKKFRAKSLEQLANTISEEVRKLHIGRKRKILIENIEGQNLTGHDEYYLKHYCDSINLLSEKRQISVRIKALKENSEQDEVNSEIEDIC